jgi:hypothetical protein
MNKKGLLVLAICIHQVSSAQTAPEPPAGAGQPLQRNIGQTRYGTGLGKLLTTERERVKIDNMRFNSAPEPTPKTATQEVVVEVPMLWHIDGISHRPNRPLLQRTSVWINGRVYAEDELPHGLSMVRNATGLVIGLNSVVSKNKTEFAKIGEDITRPQTAAEAQAIDFAATLARKPPEKP